MSSDLISRDALLKAMEQERQFLLARGQTGAEHILVHHCLPIIDSAPTVEPEKVKEGELVKAYTKGFDTGVETVRPQGEWIDYSNTFYKCPDCGYLLEKCCPHCQNKVILPKGGAE